VCVGNELVANDNTLLPSSEIQKSVRPQSSYQSSFVLFCSRQFR